MNKLIKTIIRQIYDDGYLFFKRRTEFKKFKDKKRVAIYSSVKLSDSKKKEIDDFFRENYGKKIPYTWHRHSTAFTGKFDVKYFPELLYIPEFEKHMNRNKGFADVLADKNFISLFCKAVNIRTPKVFLSKTNGFYRNENFEFIDEKDALRILNNIGEVFIKPTIDTSSGVGCFIANFKDGVDELSHKKIETILDELGENFAVQQKIVCHSSIAKIYDKSVNTFRVMTYLWNNEVCIMPVIMRIGLGGKNIDNAHAGGIFIAVNNDGTLHKQAFTEFKNIYTKHPDTDLVFNGYKIDHFEKVLTTAKKVHQAVPQLGTVSWDFTIDSEGEPVLIEANTYYGSVWLPQIAHGCGAFGNNTADVLKWLKEKRI